MTGFLRTAVIGVAGASVLAAAGCASRGRTPEIATLAPYNGEWSLEAVQPARQRIQFESRDGYGFTRQTSQRLVAAMGLRVERFVLEVSDSLFRVSSDQPGFSFALPIDGTPIAIPAEDDAPEQTMTLTWDQGTPVIRRTLPSAGWVSERFELKEDGALVVTRSATMRNFRGNEVEGMGAIELAYARNSGSRP